MITCIFGKRGSGKTTLVRGLVASCDRLFILDPLAEYTTRFGLQFHNINDLINHVMHLSNPRRDALHYCFYPPGEMQGADYLLRVSEIVQNCTVVLEEIDLICSAAYIPPYLSNSIRRGRHFNVDLICVSRRPAEVPRLLTSQAQRFYLFRFTEPRDLKYIADTFDNDTADRVSSLGQYQYLVKDL